MKTLAGIAYDVNNYGKSVLKKLLNQLFKLWKIWNIEYLQRLQMISQFLLLTFTLCCYNQIPNLQNFQNVTKWLKLHDLTLLYNRPV